MPFTAAAIAGAGVLSAGASILGSNKAASSAQQAAQLQHQQFLETQSTLSAVCLGRDIGAA